MRAWEVLGENQRKPAMTLKQVNDAKRDVLARWAADEDRMKVVGVMYRDLDRDKEWMELERTRLELEQQRLEISRLKAELGEPCDAPDDRNAGRVHDMANAEAHRRRRARQQMSDIAVNMLRRQQK